MDRPTKSLAYVRMEREAVEEVTKMESTDSDAPLRTGWYEFIRYPEATTHIAWLREDGSVYIPGGTAEEHEFWAAIRRAAAYRLVEAVYPTGRRQVPVEVVP